MRIEIWFGSLISLHLTFSSRLPRDRCGCLLGPSICASDWKTYYGECNMKCLNPEASPLFMGKCENYLSENDYSRNPYFSDFLDGSLHSHNSINSNRLRRNLYHTDFVRIDPKSLIYIYSKSYIKNKNNYAYTGNEDRNNNESNDYKDTSSSKTKDKTSQKTKQQEERNESLSKETITVLNKDIVTLLLSNSSPLRLSERMRRSLLQVKF